MRPQAGVGWEGFLGHLAARSKRLWSPDEFRIFRLASKKVNDYEDSVKRFSIMTVGRLR